MICIVLPKIHHVVYVLGLPSGWNENYCTCKPEVENIDFLIVKIFLFGCYIISWSYNVLAFWKVPSKILWIRLNSWISIKLVRSKHSVGYLRWVPVDGVLADSGLVGSVPLTVHLEIIEHFLDIEPTMTVG